MHDDAPLRHLPERSGKHYCVKCLALVRTEEYLANDHVCDGCAATDDYPLASTPDTPAGKER